MLQKVVQLCKRGIFILKVAKFGKKRQKSGTTFFVQSCAKLCKSCATVDAISSGEEGIM